MDLIGKLPGLADEDLSTLGANAMRLAQTGTPKQQKAAQEMLPAIEAEVTARQTRKAAGAPKRAPRAGRKAAAQPSDAQR